MANFRAKLIENLSFNNSFTQIKTDELLRLDKIIAEIAKNKGLTIKEWNPLDGWLEFSSKRKFKTTVETYGQAIDLYHTNLNLFDDISLPDYNNTLILIHLTGLPATYQPMLENKLQKLIYKIQHFDKSLHLVLISSQLEICESLKSSIDFLELPLLSKTEINDLIDNKNIPINKAERSQLIDMCLGLPERQIIKLLTKYAREQDLANILESKKELLAQQGLLEIIDTSVTQSDIGGLGLLKHWLERKNQLLKKLQTPEFSSQIEKPKGVLIVGMPGCGKSLTAKATANIFSMPLLKLDMGQLMGKYVGESEKNLRQALAIASRAEPCIFWIDEIEKGFSGIGGDQTGVATRLFGYFLTWLQENKSRVFVVATANDITELPPELLRKGRFDELFFVDFPNKSERKNIFAILQQKYQSQIQSSLNLDSLVNLTEGYSGADIQAIFQQAVEDSILDNKKIDLAKFKYIITQTKSIKQSLGEKLENYTTSLKKFELKPASLSDKEIEDRLKNFNQLTLEQKQQESLKNYLSDEEINHLATESDPTIIKNLLEKDNCPSVLLNRILTEHINRISSTNKFDSKYYGDNAIILDNILLKKICHNQYTDAKKIIDLYKLKQLDEKEILSIIATRKDTLAFSSIVQEDNAKPSKNLANLDEILVKPWQIVCKGQKVCGVNGKRYALGDNYPDYILVKDILAKHGDSLTQNEGLFTYLQLKPNF